MKLKGRVEYVRGVTYKAAVDLHEELDRGSYILLRANNIQDGRLSFDDVQYVDKSKVKPKQLLRKGDILICASSGSKSLVGKAALVENDMPITFGAFCCVLRPKTGEPEYLGHYFQSWQYRKAIERVCSGSNINNLKAASFESLIVPLYSKSDMLSVVGVLDALVAQKRGTESQLELLDTLVKSRFVEMFGSLSSGYKYETRKLGTLLSVNPQNGLYKPQKFYIGEGGVPIVRVDAFQAGYIESYENLRRLECSESEIEIYSLRENDIVINRVNGSIERVGKIAWIYGLVEPTVFESNMMRFHVDESRLDLAYITAFLNSSDIREQIKSRARIANQCSINQGNVADLDIPLPPLALQQEFAAFVAEVDKSRFNLLKAYGSIIALFRVLFP